MNKPLKIGLTGGIGSGKSLALSHLERLGAAVVDSDAIARAQAARGPVRRALARAFGTADRAAIAKLVFSDAAARRRLERVTHPAILAELRRRLRRAKGVVVADVPLLFEAGLEGEFDAVLTVSASRSARLERLRARGLPRAAALARMKAQLSDRAREKRADVVLRNDGTPDDFKAEVARYYRGLRLMHRSPQ